jgi:hypothetical protein
MFSRLGTIQTRDWGSKQMIFTPKSPITRKQCADCKMKSAGDVGKKSHTQQKARQKAFGCPLAPYVEDNIELLCTCQI